MGLSLTINTRFEINSNYNDDNNNNNMESCIQQVFENEKYVIDGNNLYEEES